MLIPILSNPPSTTILLSCYRFVIFVSTIETCTVRSFVDLHCFFVRKKGNNLQQLVRLNYLFSTFLLNVNFKRLEYFYVPRTRRSRTNWPVFQGGGKSLKTSRVMLLRRNYLFRIERYFYTVFVTRRKRTAGQQWFL